MNPRFPSYRTARLVLVPAFAAAAAVAVVVPPAGAADMPAAAAPVALTASASAKSDAGRPDAGWPAVAARALVADAHVPWAQAVRDVRRQDRLVALAAALRKRLGRVFGGAWIDHAHGGRLTVGVVDARAVPLVRRAALAAGLPDTSATLVRHSAVQLERIADRLGRQVAEVNRIDGGRLGVWVAAERNAVELDLPADRAALTPAQVRLVAMARDAYAGVLVLGGDTHTYTTAACDSQDACDPPLRSGVAIRTDGGRCTSAFPVQSQGRYYVLTAGHCTEAGDRWTAGTASYGTVPIGSRAGSIFGEQGDMGLIGVADPGFWRPAALVYPETAITSTGTAVVGTVVCKTGSTTGTTCGTVTRTDVTVSYEEATVRGMAYATACVEAGDSGSGVWSGSTAYGIVSGGPRFGCGMVFEPVETAVSAFGVQLVHG
jgi:streptogrisin C